VRDRFSVITNIRIYLYGGVPLNSDNLNGPFDVIIFIIIIGVNDDY